MTKSEAIEAARSHSQVNNMVPSVYRVGDIYGFNYQPEGTKIGDMFNYDYGVVKNSDAEVVWIKTN